ncbi:MAG TPA: hypothetical protein VGH28_33750 [Polyangiaceae bacterium]|jgi:hypothetical protein
MRTVIVLLLSTLLLACGSSSVGQLGDYDGGGSQVGTSSCNGSPHAGCACKQEGAQAACGEVVRRTGDYVTCSEGMTTCSGGSWGACVGDQIVGQTIHGGSLHTDGLGQSAACNDDPCDPLCQNYVDTSTNLDAGAGLTVTDAGVQITGSLQYLSTTCSSLAVTPPSATLTITNMSAINTVQFAPSLLPVGCYNGVVPALWTDDKFDISQIDSTGLLQVVTPVAGRITINAYAGTLSSPAVPVDVVVNVVDTSNAPAGYTNPALFTGSATADNITILYPYANTMLPLGQLALLPQWSNGGTTANAVKFTLRYPPTGTTIFSWSQITAENTTNPATLIAAQPRAIIPQSVWFAYEQTVAKNRSTLGDTAQIAIQRIVGNKLRTEQTRNIRFANGQLKGKIYYNSYGTNLVQNYSATYNGARFGAATLVVTPGATAPSVVAGFTSASDGPGCRVCHSVSANGNMLATEQSDDVSAVRYDLTQSPLTEVAVGTNKFAFPALAPDGSFMFTDDAFSFNNTKSGLYTIGGAAITTGTVFSTLRAGTPVFSPDGTELAFNFFGGTAAPLANPSSGVTTGDTHTLSMMTFNATTKVFSKFTNLYKPASGNAVWPSFLPTGQNGVVFEREILTNSDGGWGFTRSNCDSKGASCNQTGATGELWWVNTSGTPVATALANANGAGYLPAGANLHGLSSDPLYTGNDPNGHAINTTNFNDAVYNYEPTVLPIQTAGYTWIAFTSRRMYGNVATVDPYYSDPRYRDISQQPTPKKIWIAAIANNPTAGSDPSFPAFYLNGQELLAGNSRAYFALNACEQPGPPLTQSNVCDTDLDCCGGAANPQTAICKLDTPITNPPVKHCVSTAGGSCSPDGGSCTTDANCCNFSSGSRCSNGTCAVPPPIINYAQTQFVREYTANCPTGKIPVWRFFEWQGATPVGTSLVFQAATKNLSSDSYGTNVAIGTMAPPPAVTTTWASGPITVDQALRNTGQFSENYLRVTVTFVPKTTQPEATPILSQWRQNYDCEDGQ